MDKNAERQCFLTQELKAYEKVNPMNEEERAALRSWVSAGNSVHQNMSDACGEDGRPLDFLDVYRQDAEISNALTGMTYEEGNEYLRREYGIIREEKPAQRPKPSYDELLKKAERLFRICLLYRDVLEDNGLMDEAHGHVAEYIGAEPLFDLFDYEIEKEA